jgi:hypothetical protein
VPRWHTPDGWRTLSRWMVTIDEPERMNLLGLLLGSLLERRLAVPAAARHASKLRGDVAIDASGMRITVRFADGAIRITRGAATHAIARLGGSLTALLDATLGRRVVAHFTHGELRAGGSPIALYRLLSIVRV